MLIIQKVIVLWRSGSTLSTRLGSNGDSERPYNPLYSSIGRERHGAGSAVYGGRDRRERSFCESRGSARSAVGHVGHLLAGGFDIGVECQRVLD